MNRDVKSLNDDLPPRSDKKRLDDAVYKLGLPPHLGKVARLVLENKASKEIAVELGLSGNTVHSYLKEIFDRVGIRGKLALVVLILGSGSSTDGSDGK
jgi:DNA-binding CsgD family transcriptional regulator